VERVGIRALKLGNRELLSKINTDKRIPNTPAEAKAVFSNLLSFGTALKMPIAKRLPTPISQARVSEEKYPETGEVLL
jgi:hypothetical protein